MTSDHAEACSTAHGAAPEASVERRLAAVYAGPVSFALVALGARLWFDVALYDSNPERLSSCAETPPDLHRADRLEGLKIDANTDVVVTDHHRDDLIDVLEALLQTDARWIGLMGSPRAEPPHIEPLRSRGYGDDQIARIHRPIGLNIGSKRPGEIALSTLAGIIAERNGKPGGFDFTV